MFGTKALRAAQHAVRTPSIKFIGKRTIPAVVDHTPQPHPASPTKTLPASFLSSHATFSVYRDHAQQFGPLRKTITPNAGIGGSPAVALGPVEPPQGVYFDRNDLPERFRRQPLTPDEIEAIETGGGHLLYRGSYL
uniref:Alpha-ketoglutarate dehydrogenase subunit 4, mitochondrial n=1 Tax=Chaetomium thermophilum (strain DSM 1495 / CBS 144.50 / IMI 039719) TaxID=759272 RepID=KGD4_CHATD|nr:RecName: Full=Alpha-ketoglutarate dehydrogenase subunit 4, mitochondrial; Short=alpha-KGDH subunit 4; AltName: Full=2-oxoglutarate dehydrogenase complex component 4; Short=OGDHC subunit 4 [Thermochaetoides thermophila DSM 1495]